MVARHVRTAFARPIHTLIMRIILAHRCEDTYAESRELEPDDEETLEGKVPREIVQHNAERKALREREEAEHNPVREPLDVITMTG